MSDRASPQRAAIERLSGYIDDLLAERGPRRFLAASLDELRLLRAAARLRGARPEADRPDPEFIARLRRQLVAAAAPDAPGSNRPGLPRRQLVARLAGVAAALLAAFGLGRLGGMSPAPLLPAPQPARTPGGPLVGSKGRWQWVAELDQIPLGQALRFSAGPLEGHLIRTPDGVYALSAVCTHQGCLLRWKSRERELKCPCHGAAFDPSGRMKYGPASYRDPLPPLPSIETRVDGDQVYVWTI